MVKGHESGHQISGLTEKKTRWLQKHLDAHTGHIFFFLRERLKSHWVMHDVPDEKNTKEREREKSYDNNENGSSHKWKSHGLSKRLNY